ncbi:hypothetical protein SAMN02910357_02409 [Succinivibrio dextrinosolvens]|uniref:hypothetical protein n=1 Tax=Succinivibrio dextrinosolvens TaxID=83771 RepID=UPI0008E760F8|nr:hypothetical protein [Succinivibrio dextrinosolvens]SFS88813.1 hypothetical protein SAMN02910357_02409 [Succinivibrio dextrinosolvens]
MNIISYEEIVKTIPKEKYHNYRLRIDRTDSFVSLDKFMEDTARLKLALPPKYQSLAVLTEQMSEENPKLVLQKIVSHSMGEFGFEDLKDISFERFEDEARYAITDEIELYKRICLTSEETEDPQKV